MNSRNCTLLPLLLIFLLIPLQVLAIDSTPKQIQVESRILTVDDNFIEQVGLDLPSLGGSNCLDAKEIRGRSLGKKPSVAEQAGSSLASGLMSSFLGGGSVSGSIGSNSGGGKQSKQPFISPNPLELSLSPSFNVHDDLKVDLQLKPVITKLAPEVEFGDEGFPSSTGSTAKEVPGTLLGIRINEEAVKNSSFNIVDVAMIGPDCKRYEPNGRLLFKVYQEGFYWFSIEFWHWRNGQLIEHWKTSGSGEWSELLGTGSLPLWIGVRFDGITPEMLSEGPWNIITGWTYEKGDEMFFKPQVFSLLPGSTMVEGGDGNRVSLSTLASESTKSTVSDRTPGLGKIPMLGQLFKGTEDKNSDNLMIFVTPSIVKEE